MGVAYLFFRVFDHQMPRPGILQVEVRRPLVLIVSRRTRSPAEKLRPDFEAVTRNGPYFRDRRQFQATVVLPVRAGRCA